MPEEYGNGAASYGLASGYDVLDENEFKMHVMSCRRLNSEFIKEAKGVTARLYKLTVTEIIIDNMIAATEACQYVQQQVPEIAPQLPPDGNIYTALSALREYACRKVQEHDFSHLQQCLAAAGTLYEEGNSTVKSAVENIVVYSLSRIYGMAPEAKGEIRAIVPPALQNLYMNQVLDHGY